MAAAMPCTARRAVSSGHMNGARGQPRGQPSDRHPLSRRRRPALCGRGADQVRARWTPMTSPPTTNHRSPMTWPTYREQLRDGSRPASNDDLKTTSSRSPSRTSTGTTGTSRRDRQADTDEADEDEDERRGRGRQRDHHRSRRPGRQAPLAASPTVSTSTSWCWRNDEPLVAEVTAAVTCSPPAGRAAERQLRPQHTDPKKTGSCPSRCGRSAGPRACPPSPTSTA